MSHDEKEHKANGDEEEVNNADGDDSEADEIESRKKKIQKGDYVIQVHVIEARDLQPRDAGDTSDPMCEIKVMTTKKSTTIHKECLNVIFDERITFDFRALEPEQLNQGKCVIECYDANVLLKNELIGSFEFDLSQIYYRKHHELFKQWVALTDVTDANEGVQGYLQVTIVVLGPSDEQYIHPPEEEYDLEGGLLNVMMPPQIETDPHLLKVYVRQLEKLMVMDKLGKSSDPYVIIKFAGCENSTSRFKKKLDVHVHECVSVPVMEPILGDTIILHVKDHDIAGSDDIIGTVTFNYKKIKAMGEAGHPNHWVHLYGAPQWKQKNHAEKMNLAFIEGTTYRGSMLLSLCVEQHEEPKSETVKAVWNKKLAPKIKQWAIQVDVYQAVEVYDGVGKFQIMMMIRNLKIKTEWAECEKGMCEWYEVLRLPGSTEKTDTIELRMPEDPEQCPDVIFYLIEKKTGLSAIDTLSSKKENVISYYRFKWKDLIKYGFTTPPKWYSMHQSPVLKTMGEEDFPGTILLGIRAGLKKVKPSHGVPAVARPFLTIAGHPSKLDMLQSGEDVQNGGGDANIPYFDDRKSNANSNEQQPLLTTHARRTDAETYGTLSITIVNAQNVPGLDRDGTSDPYVEMTVGNITQKTSVQKNSTRPTWNETYQWKGISVHDSMSLNLYDWNRMTKKTRIGGVGNILLMGILQEANGELGTDFNFTKKFFVSEKYDKCTVTVSVAFDFNAKAVHERQRLINQENSSKFWKSGSGGLFKQHKKENTNRNVTIMGRPYPRNYKMAVYIYQARYLDALDDNGFSDPYFEVTYCGKRNKTEYIANTLNPQWMVSLFLNVDVPQPAEYAPRIRCSVYDWDRFTANDLIGRFFIPFLDVVEMMASKHPKWYYLYDQHDELLEGKVYIAVEFIDASQKTPPIFKIDKTAKPYFLHLLTIGVRSMRSSFGVHKPQIVYSAPVAGNVEEIATRPSSDPTARDANFLVIQKLPIKIPIDYELAPVINIVARDNLFGGLFTRSIGNSIVDLHDFMRPIPNSVKNEWVIQDVPIEILNEKELYAEIKAEDIAERREYMAGQTIEHLSMRKSVELTEARCQNRPFNKIELGQIKRLEGNDIEIEDDDEYRERCFKEEDEYKKQQDEDKAKLEKQIQAERDRAQRTRNLENDKKKTMDDTKVEVEEEEKKYELKEEEEEEDANADGGRNTETDKLLADDDEKDGSTTGGRKKKKKRGLKVKNITKIPDDEEVDSEEDDDFSSSDESSVDEEDVPEEKEDKKKLSKRQKKKLEKAKRKKEEETLKDWDKKDEESCFDLDSKVKFNPADFEPDYLKDRPRIHTALENEMDINPFSSISLKTGQKKGGFSFFTGGHRECGKIKGLWKLNEDGENPFGNGLKALVQTRTIAVRLYILNGINLVSTDRDNSSDPYLIIKLGKTKISTRKRYLPNTLQPQFHEAFEFHSNLPGPSHIIVEVWDWDGIGDDLVGRTIIDIEDRWFCKEWRRLKVKPLEERTLKNPRSQASFGKIRLWVDLMSKDEARIVPIIDISLPPKQNFQFRLIVWKAKDCVIKDEITDQNDLRCTIKMNVDERLKQETDIHWRAKYGKGSWNWRCIFPIQLPFDKRTSLHISLWDQDVFSASDSIGEVNFSLDLLLRHAYLKREDIPKIILRKDQTKRFWLNMMHSKWPDEIQGKVQVSMEIMTMEEAAKIPAGLGRGDPNMNPFLPKPEGRFLFSLNPFDMLRQLLGNKCYYKLCGILCCLACSAVLVFFFPQLFITFMSNLITGA